jgi:hypothetical protein
LYYMTLKQNWSEATGWFGADPIRFGSQVAQENTSRGEGRYEVRIRYKFIWILLRPAMFGHRKPKSVPTDQQTHPINKSQIKQTCRT